MSNFYFFTDPNQLDTQLALHAFGPAGPVDGKDQFRITDVHTSTSASLPAFAICDGLVCAQTDDQGMLTLILKPSCQPPFDFPTISYILYKGIDPSSLLVGSNIDIAQQTSNDLISAIKTTWELEANGNTGSPSRACLGLHLNPTDYPATDNPARFAATEPLDRLFYEGDPAIQLPLVRGGWRLGKFSTNFGIEIVVERIGRLPKMALARKFENIITVDVLPAAATQSEVFLHWAAKEAILDFVDPSAFWGSFFITKLRVWDETNSKFKKLSGNETYETVLRGTSTNTANFANRNRAYLDIRDEHGNSLNYYQADGPNIQFTLDVDADIDVSEVNYYASGWPSFAIDNTNLPSGITGDKINVRFALPKTLHTLPLIYISVGYRGRFRRLKDRDRFMDRPRRSDIPYLEEASITLPLVDDGGAKIASSYQKIFSFKRPLIVNGLPAAATDPGSLAPAYSGLLDYLFPVLPNEAWPITDSTTITMAFGEERYVTAPTGEYAGFAARLTVAQDSTNLYWVLTPYAYYRWPGVNDVTDPTSGLPSITFANADFFLADYAARKTPRKLQEIAVQPPPAAATQIPVEVAIASPIPPLRHGFTGRTFESTVILCLPKNEIDLILANLAAVNPLPGSIYLIPGISETFVAGLRQYTRSPLSASYLKTTPLLAREVITTTLEIYSDANL